MNLTPCDRLRPNSKSECCRAEATKGTLVILGLFTGVLAPGGVERISRHAAIVLTAYGRKQGFPCTLLSLNDPPGCHRVQVADESFTIRGFGRHKCRFVLAALAATARSHLAYIGHPNLAPVGMLMKAMEPTLQYWVATHGIDVWAPLPLLRRLALRTAHGVTAPSHYTAGMLTKMQKLSPRRIALLPWALDPGFSTPNGTSPSADTTLPRGSKC